MQKQQINHFNREIPSYQEELLAVLEAVTDPAITHLALNDLFHVVLDRICAITMADNLAVLLLNEERTFLRPRAVVGVEKAISGDVQIPFGRGFAGRIAALAAPVVIYNPSVDDVITSVLREQLHSLLGVPLIVHEQVKGQACSHQHPGSWHWHSPHKNQGYFYAISAYCVTIHTPYSRNRTRPGHR